MPDRREGITRAALFGFGCYICASQLVRSLLTDSIFFLNLLFTVIMLTSHLHITGGKTARRQSNEFKVRSAANKFCSQILICHRSLKPAFLLWQKTLADNFYNKKILIRILAVDTFCNFCHERKSTLRSHSFLSVKLSQTIKSPIKISGSSQWLLGVEAILVIPIFTGLRPSCFSSGNGKVDKS